MKTLKNLQAPRGASEGRFGRFHLWACAKRCKCGERWRDQRWGDRPHRERGLGKRQMLFLGRAMLF
ncbi:MAG: hypothetical protein DLM68_12705 [Hyphomicrobiales bacterium]|nr:MAG: hypothetical protein DLM68_12705 [Hyphomicrobiales bacterium]